MAADVFFAVVLFIIADRDSAAPLYLIPPPPLKDMFPSERRKAKLLNFSIAYGKTAHGLAEDWKMQRTSESPCQCHSSFFPPSL